jgi:hypothetical protein
MFIDGEGAMKTRRLLLCCGLAAIMGLSASSAALAVRPSMGGTVTAKDYLARTFVARWHRTNWTYKTTDQTTYWVGRTQVSWYDLKIGSIVRIGFHRIQRERVADIVRIRPDSH